MLTELLLKTTHEHSLHLQNSVMYSWGILFSACILLRNFPGTFLKSGFFDGYSPWVVALVATQAATGLAVSLVLRFADNIVRIYAHVIATGITVGIQTIQQQTPDVHLILAVVIVTCSIAVYNKLIVEDEKML